METYGLEKPVSYTHLFYSVDRFASYKQDWGGWYEQGGLCLLYTS